MSQDTRGIGHVIGEGTSVYAIQSMVDNALMTWRQKKTLYSCKPKPADPDFAVRNLQAKVYQAMCKEGSKWTPPDSHAGQPATAGQPAASSGTAERYDVYASSSAAPVLLGDSAALGTGIRTPPSLENGWKGRRVLRP
eukprot:6446265-Pyramimonas_sp.AAC.1